MKPFSFSRHVRGGAQEGLSAYGKKAVVGADLVTSTTELAGALAFSLWKGCLVVAGLGLLIVVLERLVKAFLGRRLATPQPKPRVGLRRMTIARQWGIHAKLSRPSRRRRSGGMGRLA